MRDLETEVAIIGAGTAGLAARSAARHAGATTVLFEAGPGGTTCARVGCMPSKLLIAAGQAAHATRRLSDFGLHLSEPVAIDGRAVMARVRRERDRFVAGPLGTMDRIPAAEKLAGQARFENGTTLIVGDHTRVRARAIVIATGSRPGVPAELGTLGDRVLTSDTVFEHETLPASLAVVGAGPLGIELAQAFARLGVRVAVFDRSGSIGGLADPAVTLAAKGLLGRELDLKFGVEMAAARTGEGVRIDWRSDEGEGSGLFERVLVAAGRTPNLDGLSLERAGLELNNKGIPVFDRATLRCGESAVFIAGDADADLPVLHEAASEGAIAGRNAAWYPRVEPAGRMAPLSIVYTDPEIAQVGGGWRAAEGEDVVTGETDLAGSGRARVMNRNAGLIRVYARRSDGRLLGGEMIGPDCEHLAHLLAWAVQRGMTPGEVLALPFYHPTIAESLRSAVRQLCTAVRSWPARREEDLEFGPGG